MRNIIGRINKPGTKHLYEIEIVTEYGLKGTIEVEANNRSQAARLAAKFDGPCDVWSVNMTG